jgi:hypothetical protein
MSVSAKPVCTIATAMLLTGCAGGFEPLQLATTGSLPIFSEPGHPGSPPDVYARVARGMLACWFAGADGLRKTHIFNGDVPPPATGEQAEIVVHERDARADNPRGLAALRVSFVPRSATRTDVLVTTPRFIGAEGRVMKAAIERWAAGDPACDKAKHDAWSPAGSEASAQANAKASTKNKAKAKTKARQKASPPAKRAVGGDATRPPVPAGKPKSGPSAEPAKIEPPTRETPATPPAAPPRAAGRA